MKLEKLVIHEQALETFATLPLEDAQKSWDISVGLDTARGHIKKFKEKQDEIIKKLGKPVEGNPDQFQVPTAKVSEFTKEIEKLGAVDVAIKFPKISIKELNGAKISPSNVSALRDLCILTK